MNPFRRSARSACFGDLTRVVLPSANDALQLYSKVFRTDEFVVRYRASSFDSRCLALEWLGENA